MRAYEAGVDVLGDGFDASQITSMIPMLSAFTGKAGGGSGSSGNSGAKPEADTSKAIARALQEERARQSAEKAAAQARTTNMLLIGVLGAVGIGTIVLLKR